MSITPPKPVGYGRGTLAEIIMEFPGIRDLIVKDRYIFLTLSTERHFRTFFLIS